jgi:hypothetical protein
MVIDPVIVCPPLGQVIRYVMKPAPRATTLPSASAPPGYRRARKASM